MLQMVSEKTTRRYSANISAGSLKLPESRIVAGLLLKGIDPDAWHHAIVEENVLQARNPVSAVRIGRLVRHVNLLELLVEYLKGRNLLGRVHQSMILFAAGRGEAVKRFLVEEGAGRDGKFWKLAQSLSALYPPGTDEKRWVDGVLARKKGLGL